MPDLKFTEAGKRAYDKFGKAVEKLEREYVKEVGQALRPVLKDAVADAKRRVLLLFGGRGKRFQQALVHQVRFKGDNLDARFGYVGSKKTVGGSSRRRFWWLGRIYEFGGTITPRKRAKLWVPIGDNRRGDGSPFVTPRRYFTQTSGGRGVVKMSSRGNLIAFGKDGDQLKPMFVLKDSIPIQQRSVVTPAAETAWPKAVVAAGVGIFNNFKKNANG